MTAGEFCEMAVQEPLIDTLPDGCIRRIRLAFPGNAANAIPAVEFHWRH
jgi:hypothetical protein